MMQHQQSYRLSHLVLRVLAGTNLLLLSLWLFPQASHDLANGPLGGPLAAWSAHSLWVLPAYFCLEMLVMRRSVEERKPLVVDGVLVLGACLSIVGSLWYVWTHYALI